VYDRRPPGTFFGTKHDDDDFGWTATEDEEEAAMIGEEDGSHF